MKKTLIFMLVLTMVMALTACGGSDEAAAPEATEIPTATVAPQGAESGTDMVGAMKIPDKNAPDYQEPDSEEYRTAMSMIGEELADLIEVIGEPLSSSYSASCIAPGSGAQDGYLSYKDFTVSTLLYPNGTEIVMGAF